MRKDLLLLFFIIFSTGVSAQIQPDTVVVDSLEIAAAEEEMIYKEDTADFVFYAIPSEVEYVPGDDDPEVYRERLKCIEKNLPLTYNDKTHAFINYFTVKDREYTRWIFQ